MPLPPPPVPTRPYDECASLMQDLAFQGRIKVACLHFANEILMEDAGTPAHNTRFKWAQGCNQNPQGAAAQIQHSVVMHPKVQGAGKDVTDPDLQIATEEALTQGL